MHHVWGSSAVDMDIRLAMLLAVWGLTVAVAKSAFLWDMTGASTLSYA